MVLALTVDSLIPAHNLRGLTFSILRMSTFDAGLCVQGCGVQWLVLSWALVAAVFILLDAIQFTTLKELIARFSAAARRNYTPLATTEPAADRRGPSDAPSFRQRTTRYSAVSQLNYFDQEAVPELLHPYSETIYIVVESVSRLHGFQMDSARNQAEHLLMMLYNETQPSDAMVSVPAQRIHLSMFANYRKWCARMGVPSALLKDCSAVKSFEFLIEDVLTFLLVWGEAANLKHMPECLCFLLHKALLENVEMKNKTGWKVNDGSGQPQVHAHVPGRYPGFYLDMVITPLYEVVAKAIKTAHGMTYDDFNEFFWSPHCLEYELHNMNLTDMLLASPAPMSAPATGSATPQSDKSASNLLASALQRAKKTYREKRSWLHPLFSMSRVFEWHVITFTLLATYAFSNVLQWTYAYTLKTGSFVFLEITFFGLLWTALEVWTLFPDVDVSGPSKCGYLLRLVVGIIVLSYQCVYYHWSYVTTETASSLDELSFFHDVKASLAAQGEEDFQTYWWWQYVWLSLLSCVFYFLESLMCWFPVIVDALMAWDNTIVQAFLSVCYPLSQLYVGKAMNVKTVEVFRYIFFWLTLLAFKLWFGYYYIVSPVAVPSLLLFDDYMNYEQGYGSFVKTAFILFFWWFPHFLVYLIDLSIWYSVWASIVGGFIAILDRQGAVRESPTFRKYFMGAPLALCHNMLPHDSELRDDKIQGSVSTADFSGINTVGKAPADMMPSSPSLVNTKSPSRAKSSANVADFVRQSSESTSNPAAFAGFESYQQNRALKMLDALDVRSQRWMIFGRVWNEIIFKLRQGDYINNTEQERFLFTQYEWLSKPIYLPLYQTAGCVGVVALSLREASERYHKEPENAKKILVMQQFDESLALEAKEAVTETWELTGFLIKRLLGPVHHKDIDRIILVLTKWADSLEILYRFSGGAHEPLLNHLTNIVNSLHGCVEKRKRTPVVSPEVLQQRDDKQKFLKAEYNGGAGNRVKKSSSTGLLTALLDGYAAPVHASDNGSAAASPRVSTADNKPPVSSRSKKFNFQQLTPFTPSADLVDSVRDNVREEVRSLLGVLRNALKVKNPNAEALDLVDRLIFMLSLESGFMWSDVYASTQIDELAADSRSPGVLSKLKGLLTLRVTQVELKSPEARRRLNFFLNSLFMQMPNVPAMRFAKEYTCITPYYSEDILLARGTLQECNNEGVSTMLYLQTLYRDDWTNFLERRGIKKEHEIWSEKHLQELRMWASSRAQTLFRTVEGMMQTEAAIRLLAELEQPDCPDLDVLAVLKFNYVVACQIYGPLKKKMDPKAEDIEFLMARHPNLRVAYVDTEMQHPNPDPTFSSVLIKHNPQGGKANPVSEVYRVKLPGNPIIGEGKPENQNHALVFTRGRYLQAIDMNQDGYFEEALKMRNLLEEFESGCVILGFREHIFTGSVSSVANYMALQELSFVTLGQRVLNQPLRIRQHYGHPDLFKKMFVMTEGGMSKASKGINLSEDVFAGFNATIRGHSVGFKEYVQVGKGRDVGLQQTYKFEAKLAQGNAEQSLSRDMNRICGRLDFFRLFSFYYGGIGHYMANTMVMFTLVVVVYTMLALAIFGEEGVNGRPMHPEGVLQLLLSGMGILQTMPLLITLTVEKGVVAAISEIGFMILSGGPLYFIFHIETKSFYFSQTLMAGGAKYRPTGRAFVTSHSSFDENFRFFASSHIYLGFEIFAALILFGLYTTSTQYGGLTWSLWMTVASFLLGPFWFNPLSFEWSRISDDYKAWVSWMAERGGSSQQCWDSWWKEEVELYDTMSVSWKIFLIIQRGAPWVLISVGVAGSNFLHSWEEQSRVLEILGVFVAFLCGNWIIYKFDIYWPYALRRFATLFLWSITGITFAYLFFSHAQYVRYTVSLYYLAATVSFVLLLLGVRHTYLKTVYMVHDYVVGHSIFAVLSILSIIQVRDSLRICSIVFSNKKIWFDLLVSRCSSPIFLCTQVGYLQTWLLYHNAISSGVEVQDILKHARTSKETTHVVADEVGQLRKQVDAQQLLIRQLLEKSGGPQSSTHAAFVTGGSGKRHAFTEGDTELTSLMQKSPEPAYAFKSAAAVGLSLAPIPSYGATSSAPNGANAVSPRAVPAAPVLSRETSGNAMPPRHVRTSLDMAIDDF